LKENKVTKGSENLIQFDDREFEQAYEEEMNNVNAQLKKEIIFAMIGDVNAG
jgi:GTPase